MFSNQWSPSARAAALAGVLTLPNIALGADDLESRISALEVQVNELTARVEMLAAALENSQPAKSDSTRDLKSTWMLYDSRGQKKTGDFWPDFWSKARRDGN